MADVKVSAKNMSRSGSVMSQISVDAEPIQEDFTNNYYSGDLSHDAIAGVPARSTGRPGTCKYRNAVNISQTLTDISKYPLLSKEISLRISCIYFLSSPLVLKIGSFSFECIEILLIYFINCQKALFTRKCVSFSKKYRVKSSRLAVMLGIP